MRIAQILHDKAHYIFEADAIPNWPPDPQGNPIVLVDITSTPEVQEGWDYDGTAFTEPVYVEPTPTAPIPLTEAEQTQLEMSLNLDYLVTLADLGL